MFYLKMKEVDIHPFSKDIILSFILETTDVTGTITLSDGVEMVIPGDNVTISVELQKEIAMEKGLRFAIREGGKTVGAGQVTEILD